jgi:hypothetical protein
VSKLRSAAPRFILQTACGQPGAHRAKSWPAKTPLQRSDGRMLAPVFCAKLNVHSVITSEKLQRNLFEIVADGKITHRFANFA